jgi:hypothetical protein
MISPYTPEGVLAHRNWQRCSVPFPHVTARSAFTQVYFEALSRAFDSILADGVEDGSNHRRLSHNMVGYDARGLTFPPRYQGPFSLFMSRPWHDMLARLFDAECTGHINCGLHHHDPGSADGWVHNDLNPAYFVDYPAVDGINVVRNKVCNYSYGTDRADLRARQVIRRVAMLLYLGNPSWSPADGGGTGLYSFKDDPVKNPAAVVLPIDNSILAFECTPYSFHSFLSNPRNPRNSLIMWLHCEPRDAFAKWGEGSIVEWPQRAPMAKESAS